MKEKTNVLIIGSGGREHSLGWKLKQSKFVDNIYFIPGNGGTKLLGENISIEKNDFQKIKEIVESKNITLTVVGNEEFLVNGIVDFFYEENLPKKNHFIFGPTKLASEIEGSKSFAKNFMIKNKIPTAEFFIFKNFSDAENYLKNCNYPIVIKANGLAAGKGVAICNNQFESITTAKNYLIEKTLGESGNEIIVEEFLSGKEISILAISDGNTIKPFLSVQDHKKIFDGDNGPNTGGMGAYSPIPFVSKKIMDEVYNTILVPTIAGLKNEGRKFCGCLFAGLMFTKNGIKVLEFNCRFGDPETQPLMQLLENDLYELLMSCSDSNYKKKISELDFKFTNKYACCVVASSNGYPNKYEIGKEIFGLEKIDSTTTTVFHAGTKFENGKFFTNGGRVLNVVSLGNNLNETIQTAYNEIKKISFDGIYFRNDIGHCGLK